MRRQLITALFPLILFWVVEEFYGLKAALVAGCIAAVIEVIWEWRTAGRVSFLVWAGNGLVLGLGAVSLWMDSGVAFKLQPAVMEIGMAGLMLSVRFRGGEPFMLRTFRDAPVDPARREAALSQPWFVKRLLATDTRLMVFLVFHAAAVSWVALYGSTRLWILLKGVLFYVLLVLVMVPMMRQKRRQ